MLATGKLLIFLGLFMPSGTSPVGNSSQTNCLTTSINITIFSMCTEIRYPEGTGKGKIKNLKEISDIKTSGNTIDYKKKEE